MNADLRTIGMTGAAGAGLVSATYKPSSLTSAEAWRLTLRSKFPRSRSPLVRFVFAAFSIMLASGFVGFLFGMVAWPNITPEKMAMVCAVYGSVLWVGPVFGVAATLKVLRSRGPMTFEVDEAGLTRRGDYRLTWHEWAGVVGVRQTDWDLVFFFDAGDIAWFPRRAFLDPDHEGRFLEIVRLGLAQARPSSSDSSRDSDW